MVEPSTLVCLIFDFNSCGGEEIETRSFNGEVGTSVREDVKNRTFNL